MGIQLAVAGVQRWERSARRKAHSQDDLAPWMPGRFQLLRVGWCLALHLSTRQGCPGRSNRQSGRSFTGSYYRLCRASRSTAGSACPRECPHVHRGSSSRLPTRFTNASCLPAPLCGLFSPLPRSPPRRAQLNTGSFVHYLCTCLSLLFQPSNYGDVTGVGCLKCR